jgi:hypothetical protein
MARQRPFNPGALEGFAGPDIRPPLGVGALVWRYLVLVPLEETKPGAEAIRVADREALENLRATLSDHFGGVTMLQPLVGAGLREEGNLDSLELNSNLPFVVYARPIAMSDKYFETLQQELQAALGQGLILVERQEAFLIGTYGPAGLRAIVPPIMPGQLPTESGSSTPLPAR